MENEIQRAIKYFKDAVTESDEIIDDCNPALQAELIEQKEYFILALDVLERQTETSKKARITTVNGLDYCECGHYLSMEHTDVYCTQCGRELER